MAPSRGKSPGSASKTSSRANSIAGSTLCFSAPPTTNLPSGSHSNRRLDLGGHVRKGHEIHAGHLLQDLEKRDDAGNLKVRDDGRPERVPFVRWANVFNLDQTEVIEASGDRGSARPDAFVGTCRRHCRKRETLPDSSRGICRVLLRPRMT